MSNARKYGHFDLFIIAMTNLSLPEIKDSLLPGQDSQSEPTRLMAGSRY